MNEAEIILIVRQLAIDVRTLSPSDMLSGAAYKSLLSVPGKGGPLTQLFNREPEQRRKRIISDIMGHLARVSHQQTPEYYQAIADELEKLCDRLDGIE